MSKNDVILQNLVHCVFIFWVNSQDLTGWKRRVLVEKVNAIWWNIKINRQKSVDINVNMNCQQICIISHNGSEHVTKSFRGGVFFWNTSYINEKLSDFAEIWYITAYLKLDNSHVTTYKKFRIQNCERPPFLAIIQQPIGRFQWSYVWGSSFSQNFGNETDIRVPPNVFLVFLMQFGLPRGAALVSSPIHLLL